MEHREAFEKFAAFCREGRLNDARIFHDEHQFSPSEVKSDDNALLRAVCAADRLPVLKWLHDQFRFTSEDVRSGYTPTFPAKSGYLSPLPTCAFRAACNNGCLDTPTP